MSEWQSPKVQLPPQGVKILWFKGGDVFIAQRIGNKYLSLQPGEAVILDEPMLWLVAPVPHPFEGLMRVKVEDEEKLMTIDELEKKFPQQHKQFVALIDAGKWKE